jgi:ATP-binding cassette subfamily B protein
MDISAWMALESAMQGEQQHRGINRATLRRIAEFARPHRRALVVFLILSILSAVLSVATPVLAGRVVDAIVGGGSTTTVVGIAILIAVIAVVEAGVGLAGRWQSSRIGEGLILDLRTAVFAHVQRMPIAFFTRTRTGALVSRLNNDVIGAQRAFSSTLASVVSNVIALALTLAVMIGLSWQVTLLALLLLPVFVIPARRMGNKLAGLEREASTHNAAMLSQMTERFSAPGATLVKLYGRPEDEIGEFSHRAARVRDIGVQTAMSQWIFITALTLVSALALALVYGLGGSFALTGQLDAGSVVTLALLLTRLYSPLTALASARVDVMAALVSFERVFEVLDIQPLITERPNAGPLPSEPVSVEFDNVFFSYPAADKVSLASLEEVASLDTRGGDEVLHGVSFKAEPGQLIALVGSSGAGKSTIASLAPRLYDVDSGAVRLAGIDVRDLTFDAIRGALGMVTQDGHLFHESVRANLLFARPEATDSEIWDALRRARLDTLILQLPDGLNTVVGGARLSPVWRRAAAPHHRAAAAGTAARGHPGRGDGPSGLGVRGGCSGGDCRGAGWPHGAGDRPPALDHPRRRHDPGDRSRPHRRARHSSRTPGSRRALRRTVPDAVRAGREDQPQRPPGASGAQRGVV